jgi:hypothetical protein
VETRAYQLAGGSVVIRIEGSKVTLASASPNGGFTMTIDDAGPPTVKVEFESSSHESTFRAKVDGGELDVDIDEEPKDGDDDGGGDDDD